MKRLQQLLSVLILSACAAAQVTVTATVKDANSNPYANGTVAAQSIVASGQQAVYTTPVPTNASGAFSIVLPSTGTYVFTVCAPPVLLNIPGANASPTQVCFSTTPVLITTSVDISAQTNAAAAILGPANNGGGGSSSGFSCGTPQGPGVPYWNGIACLIDLSVQLDGSGGWTGVSATYSGAVTAQSLGTLGSGGVLHLGLQAAPSSVPVGQLQVYGDQSSGLIGCRNSALTSCMGSVQIIASGSTVLPAVLVSANGGCNVYTSTATGATSSNGATVSVHGVDVTGVSGYAPGQLWVYPPFVGTNLISFKVCNPTAANITPASLTIFWNILPQ